MSDQMKENDQAKVSDQIKKIILQLLLAVFTLATTNSVRVSGEFIIKSITADKRGFFTVIFTNTAENAKINTLRLETRHLHVAIEQGKRLRLSAEVSKWRGNMVEAKQILVFVPTASSHTPIWLLSRHSSSDKKLQGAKYLDMHAPQSDFLVL